MITMVKIIITTTTNPNFQIYFKINLITTTKNYYQGY